MGLIVNFSDFVNKTGTSLSASDYVVGFTTKLDGSKEEIKTTLADVVTFFNTYSGLNSVFTTVNVSSSNWNSVYTSVKSESSTWINASECLSTILDYVSTNVTRLSGISFSNEVKIVPIVEQNYSIGVFGPLSGQNFSVSFNSASASGEQSFAVNSSTATSPHSLAQGYQTNANGLASHSQGYQTNANSLASHAEGYQTTSSGWASHAEGRNTQALGDYSHAEGINSVALGNSSHAQGSNSFALGPFSRAEGENVFARGFLSKASGRFVESAHDRSWIWKGSTEVDSISTTKTDQFVVSALNGVFIPGNVGIGTDENTYPLQIKGTTVTDFLSVVGDATFASLSTTNINVDNFSNTVGLSTEVYLSITVAGSAFKIPLFLP